MSDKPHNTGVKRLLYVTDAVVDLSVLLVTARLAAESDDPSNVFLAAAALYVYWRNRPQIQAVAERAVTRVVTSRTTYWKIEPATPPA